MFPDLPRVKQCALPPRALTLATRVEVYSPCSKKHRRTEQGANTHVEFGIRSQAECGEVC